VERQAGRPITPQERGQLLDQFINMKLAADAATKSGLEKDPKIAAQLEVARLNVIVDSALQKYIETHPVTDAELKPEYDAKVAQMPKEYHARHILVDEKAAADQITADLKKGADFAKLAQQKSKDSSGKEGGDLGWFTLDSMVKPFSDAVAALQPGQLTDQPVQSQFGWHVIKLEDTRAVAPPPFEQVKDQVKMMVERQRVQKYFDELRKDAKIEKMEGVSAPAAAPASEAPAPAAAQ
jgi:peptidyl-prolyl cis-trans isomerase C